MMKKRGNSQLAPSPQILFGAIVIGQCGSLWSGAPALGTLYPCGGLTWDFMQELMGAAGEDADPIKLRH